MIRYGLGCKIARSIVAAILKSELKQSLHKFTLFNLSIPKSNTPGGTHQLNEEHELCCSATRRIIPYSANSDLFLAKGYIRRHFFPICKLSISASSKTNMDGCYHSAIFTKVGLIINRKRDNSSCYELITRAATRGEMKSRPNFY